MAGGKAMSGDLKIIGVGPGDPDLLTIKAVKAIQTANVIAFPETESGRTRARDIAAKHLHETQTQFAFTVPMRTETGPARAAYDQAADDIASFLAKGNRVALLCEGDPFFYGSAMYIHTRLSDKFETTVIPGITSLTACAAAISHPLAARDDVLKIIPATLDAEIIEAELAHCNSAAIIKVGRHLGKVRSALEKHGLISNARMIAAATTSEEFAIPLAEFVGETPPYFSTILVYRGEDLWR